MKSAHLSKNFLLPTSCCNGLQCISSSSSSGGGKREKGESGCWVLGIQESDRHEMLVFAMGLS